MKDSNLYLLLDVIFRNGSVKRLSRQGISFTDVAKMTNEAIAKKLITNSDEKIILTDSGIELLKNLEIKYKKTNKEEWIEKDFKNKVPKLDKNVVFLPRQNELTF